MKKTNLIIILFIFLLPFTLNGNDLIIKISNNNVNDTVEKIKNIINSKKGLDVFTVIDHKKGATKVNMKLDDTKVIVFGNPKLGTTIMHKNKLAALDLPLKILVFSDNGITKIVYRDPILWAKKFNLSKYKFVNKMSKVLSMISSKASK